MSELDSHARALPSAPDAEEAILGCLMLNPIEVSRMMSERHMGREWFINPANAEIHGTILRMMQQNLPIEFLLLCQNLRDIGKLESCGGAARISEINRSVPTAVNAGHYLDILQEKHLLRRIITIGTLHASGAYVSNADPVTILAEMHAEVTSLLHRKSDRPTLADVVREVVEEVRTGRDDVGRIDIGMDGVNGRLLLYRGDLLVISAPTSCGKTALAAQMAFATAAKGHRVALYPLEMAQKQTVKRAIAQLGGNNAEWVRNVVKSAGSDPMKVEKAMPIVRTFIDMANTVLKMDPHMRDDLHGFEAICADLRAEHIRKPFSFVVVDYLQLIQTAQKFERKQLQIAYITQGFKRLAKELDCVVCLPSQVNKQGGTREAEDAENDAAALIRIHGEEDKSGDVHPGRVSVWKQREGKRHIDLPLKFNGLLTRFEYKEDTSHIAI